ncbi:MAG: hypothetical protein RAK20_05810, partial [Conexivisphaerales archaeon]|nr:hypothetical protein [Conexivisphaerales archaeon]
MSKNVLITGFEPFLDYKINPTQEIARVLDGKEINGLRYSGRVLPVDYSRLEEKLMKFIQEVRPDLIIGTGLAAGRAKISLEKIAINYKFSLENDNSGKRAVGERIDNSMEDGIFSLINVEELFQILNSVNIPAEISLSAGSYLCNYAMFVIIREAKKLNIKGGFVHFPANTKLSSSLP